MLIGTYKHSIDDKGRIAVPAKFRTDLGEQFIAARGTDKCVALFPAAEWELQERAARKQLSKKEYDILSRFYFSTGSYVGFDSQGRICIPSELRASAELKGSSIVIGAGDRVEIWNLKNWQQASETVTQDMLLDLLDKINLDL